MFSFIKNLFKKNPEEQVRTIPVEGIRIITDEKILRSVTHLISELIADEAFNKRYKCIRDFMNNATEGSSVPKDYGYLTLDELSSYCVDNHSEKFVSTGVTKLAKRYAFLGCKCLKCPAFDEFMSKVSCINEPSV